ncbi:pilus assembly protein TadG-related protein [Pseudomonas sp. App30]|uniref:pilus assembly protein TadG-related protein n=1 Tax=Pseudomonas sp. App30 TaxID=3068990 RepID=UPI003A803C49
MVPRFAYPYRQRGAIGLMAAITLGMALLFMLLVIDSGRLYLEQRKLQRVVDAAALEASNLNAVCSGTGVNALTQATTSAARNGLTVGTGNTLTVTCGTLSTGSNNLRAFTANATATQAIQVVANETVATSVAAGLWGMVAGGGFNANTVLRATATAGYVGNPLAQLSIRSTLATVNTAQSSILNPLFSGLLGGNVNLSVDGWNGLITTDVNLLSYLNRLALNLGVSAGNYTQLLATNVSVGQLVQAAIDVLPQSGNTATITTSLAAIQSAAINVPNVTLGSLLQLQSGATTAGLNANIQLFQLIQSFVQLANSASSVSATLPVSVLGLANVTTRIKVIEPPQLSAIGNPTLAVADPTLNNPNRIYVKTAQVRALVSVNLPVLTSLSGLTTLLTDLVSSLANVLGSLLQLNLVATLNAVSCLLGAGCEQLDLLPMPSPEIDIGLELASAQSYITAFSCTSNKSITAHTLTSAATLKIGQIDASTAFSSSTDMVVNPLRIIDIGTKTCHQVLGIGSCGPRTAGTGGGLGILVNTTVAGNTTDLIFNSASAPPNVGLTPSYLTLSNSSIVNSLASTISGIQVQAYKPVTSNLLGDLLVTVSSLLGTLNSLLLPVIQGLLSPLLDPLLNQLLSSLGIDLTQVQVGANLTCQTGRAQLVL